MGRLFLSLGALAGLVAVAAGAFGAHALRDRLAPSDLALFETAVRYQMYHALALLVAGWAGVRAADPLWWAAGWGFATGIVVFSGSLYLLALGEARWPGAITPLGGLLLLAGWGCLALAALRAP